MECVTGLPTDSISLDSVNIYWSGPAGVFSVPRNDVTMLSQFAAVSNISSVVTIDPGQQQLPSENAGQSQTLYYLVNGHDCSVLIGTVYCRKRMLVSSY